MRTLFLTALGNKNEVLTLQPNGLTTLAAGNVIVLPLVHIAEVIGSITTKPVKRETAGTLSIP